MGYAPIQIGWSDAQWEQVAQVVTEEVSKTSVTSAILPSYGPAPDGVDVVRKNYLSCKATSDRKLEVSVDDTDTTPLQTVEIYVRLRPEQVRDTSLVSALAAFRRAANLLAMAQDAIVFYGNRAAVQQAIAGGSGGVAPKRPLVDIVAASEANVKASGLLTFDPPATKPGKAAINPQPAQKDKLVEAIQAAVSALDKESHSGPFACILGNDAFFQAHDPGEKYAVLPVKRMERILKGPVLRSGSLAGNAGIVLAVSAEPFDLVLGTPPQIEFLQIDGNEDHVFRVYERFILRIKDETAIYSFQVS